MHDLDGRRVLITGGLGFLGLNIVPALLAAGAAVRILNRTVNPVSLGWLRERIAGGASVEVQPGDIADSRRLPQWLDGIDAIVNLAAESGAVKSLENAERDMQVNIAGQLRLLDAVRAARPQPRVVFISSRLVYGITGSAPVAEDRPPHPTSLYGLHKLTVEHYYRIYHQQHGVRYVILRLTNPYGPFQLPERSDYGIVNSFVMTALRGGTLRLFGGGVQLRDYVHAEDVAAAVVTALHRDEALGQVFNVGSGRPTSFGDAARLIVELAGSGEVRDAAWPEEFHKVETGDFVCDIDKIRRVLGWRPSLALDEGLARTVAAYRSLLAQAVTT